MSKLIPLIFFTIFVLYAEEDFKCVKGNCFDEYSTQIIGDMIYEGDYLEGYHHGEGTLTAPEGKYSGTFVLSNIINGTFTSSDGLTRYTGGFKEYKYEGLGFIYQKNLNGDERTLEGNFINGDLPNGILKINDVTYKGELKDGEPFGEGVMKTSVGKLEGVFTSYKDFIGVLTEKDGTVIEGQWKNGEFFKSMEELKFEEESEAARIKRENYYKFEAEQRKKAKKEKYDKIYSACILDKSSGVDMRVPDLRNALVKTCEDIANDPSFIDEWKYN
tara:strand:- start:100 stop:921 length:822 start_codon:yes stop_codon:yes gene_type:complete